MAARTFKIQHIFHGSGGTTKDQYVNTFYAWGDVELNDNHASGNLLGNVVAEFFCRFYDDNNGTAAKISEYLSPRVGLINEQVKIYDVADPPHTGPIWDYNRPTLVSSIPGGQTGLPEEVALCLSYRAVDSGGNFKRRRGRIYIGPLNVAAIDDLEATTQPVRPAGALIEAMLQASQDLAGRLESVGMVWRLFSKTDGFGFTIVEVSVDDAFDTVRGRGTAPSGRTELTLT